MGQFFQQALKKVRDNRSLVESQRLWLAERDSRCGALADTAIWSCLLEMTKLRTAALSQVTPGFGDASAAQTSPAPVTSTTLQSRTEFTSNSASSGVVGPLASQTSQNDRSTDVSSQGLAFSFAVSLVVFALGLTITLSVFNGMRHKRRMAEEQQLLEDLRAAEENRLVVKYGEEIAARILAHEVWQGMTAEQLTESWGNPADVGREIIRARIKETWKYQQTGRNRFSNRVYLENGIVIGWKI
jgi:hypothetical protein